MKELSIEEKAKRYDEAIAHAKLLLKTIGNATLGNLVLKNEFENMFPELKESEDEVIGKEIVNFINHRKAMGSITPEESKRTGSWLAWLEKQGEQKSINNLSSQEAMDIAIAKCFDEQNPTNNIEPKFHEGDWVVYNNDICQIVKREEGCNKLVTVFGIEKELVNERNLSTARLWTIQDAKEGDVLYTSSTASHEIFLFKGLDENGNIECLCSYDSEDGFREGKYHFIGKPTFRTKPATKEQKELLFEKIRENGFEYDSKKNWYIKKRVPKEYAIIIDGVRHNLVSPKIEDCGKCSLDKFCDKFKEALCDSLVGRHTGMIFEKENSSK